MDVLFWHRKSRQPGADIGTIYCTVTLHSVGAQPFSTGITCRKAPDRGRPRAGDWVTARPRGYRHGDAPDVRADNDTLALVDAALKNCRNVISTAGDDVTAAAVVALYKVAAKRGAPAQAVPTLAEAAARFLAAAHAQRRAADAVEWEKKGLAKGTLQTYRSRHGNLLAFLEQAGTKTLPLAEFTAKRADAFAAYLLARPGVGRTGGAARTGTGYDYAGKNTLYVSQVLDYAVNNEWLATNPLSSYKSVRGSDKPCVWLTMEQVAALASYRFASEYMQRVADAFLFCCWTGLAWSDADAFDAGVHLTPGPDGSQWLAKYRVKTGVEFAFPLLPGAARILAKYPAGLPKYANAVSNRLLKEIAAVVGIEQHLTHHVGRRTFGMFLLNEGRKIETVSSVLGHKNIRTTQRHYASFLTQRAIAADLGPLVARLAAAAMPPAPPARPAALETLGRPADRRGRFTPDELAEFDQ